MYMLNIVLHSDILGADRTRNTSVVYTDIPTGKIMCTVDVYTTYSGSVGKHCLP